MSRSLYTLNSYEESGFRLNISKYVFVVSPCVISCPAFSVDVTVYEEAPETSSIYHYDIFFVM